VNGRTGKVKELNIAMIGTGFMGKAHALVYSAMPLFFWPPPATPVRKVVVDVTDDLASSARDRLGFADYATNWKDVVGRPDIDVVDICTPNNSHAEIAIAAAKAGKHILCEKPLALDAAEAKAMLDAVEAAGVTHMVAFNYRHAPAVIMAKQLVDAGRVGEILTFHGRYLQDWSADPGTPLSWRFQKKLAGSGALGDVGTHIIDMTRYIMGDFQSVNAIVRTHISERPLQQGVFDKMASAQRDASGPKGPVDVDDAFITMIRFANGAAGTIEATRNAYGHHNGLGFEINGTKGSIIFDYQRLNELQVMFGDDQAQLHGFRTLHMGPAHPYGEHLWPIPGLGVGYIDVKIIECFNFIKAVTEGRPGEPNFRDGYEIARICDAIVASGASQKWEAVADY
jgi:predicted dehydrogenase